MHQDAPGCIRDSQVSEWGILYEKLAQFNQKFLGKVVVDSAFDKSRYEFLIKSAKDEGNLESAAEVN